MANTIKTIKLHVQEIQHDKKRFPACSAEIRGTWYKIKFTQDVSNAPKKKGIYDLTINFDDCSVENGKLYTNKEGEKVRGNSTIWVRAINSLRRYTEEELKAENRAIMCDIFGEEYDGEVE